MIHTNTGDRAVVETAVDIREKRVLLSGHLPPPMGGIASFYQSLLQSSLSEKVDLEFVQTSSQSRSLSDSGRASISNLVSAVRDCLRFYRAVRKHRPAIAHIATAPGLSFLKHSVCVLMARSQGSAVLIHPHCSLKVLYHERPEAWRMLVERIIEQTAGLIALSKEWEEISEIIPGHPVFLLPNATQLGAYQAIARERAAAGEREGKVRILYLGYVGKAKGSFDLVDAAAQVVHQHAQAEFVLIGAELEKGERSLLKERVRAAGLETSVQILEPVYDDEKLQAFASADLFVYPSYHEGMPMAVIEAMAAGLPIVATRVGGLPDLVREGENGLLVSAGQPRELAEALIHLVEDSVRRRSMRQASSRIAAEQYDIEKLVDQLVEIYSQV